MDRLSSVVAELSVDGVVGAGYERVADEFERNFTERADLGAAFSAVADGRPVVDVWGGLADLRAGRSWRTDTLQLTFSSTKGLVAICMLMLVDRHELSLDAPVSDYWPEFGRRGKAQVTVADVLSHRARLPGIHAPIRRRDLLDDRRMADVLAGEALETDPRAVRIYHALTFGWLCGELIRRVSGRSVGRFFAEEVAEPLELDAWIGLPASLEPRVSTLVYGSSWARNYPPWTEPDLERDPLLTSVFGNPPLFPPDDLFWNEATFHRAEIPGINGIGTARSFARLYGSLAQGGRFEDARIVTPQLLDQARQELSAFRDPLLDEPKRYGIGFQLQTEQREFGAPDDAFGHVGAGGSVHGAWPQQRVGFAYVMNEMRSEPGGDVRAHALLERLFEAVEQDRGMGRPRAKSEVQSG